MKPTTSTAVLILTALLAVSAAANDPLPYGVVTVGTWLPFGEEMGDWFGPRYPLGLETRVRSQSGIGGAFQGELWWATADSGFSWFAPANIEMTYGHEVAGGSLVPFAGLYGQFCLAQLRLTEGEDRATASGTGFGYGLTLGTEVSLGRRLKALARVRVGLGDMTLGLPKRVGSFAPGDHRVSVSAFSVNIGLSTDLTEPCLW